MTEKLYLFPSPPLSIIARVLHIAASNAGTVVELDRTVMHAKGGGQPPDRGTLGGVPVIDVVHAERGRILHLLGGPLETSAGDDVEVHVDTGTRQLHAALHTAGHLIGEVLLQHGVSVVKAQHYPGSARLVVGPVEASRLDGLAALVQVAIDSAIGERRPVRVLGDLGSDRRIQIGDSEPIRCGGTHLSSLAALARVTVDRARRKADEIRLSYEVELSP